MNLRRATRDRWIFGVCGGIAHAYGWNPLLVRLVPTAVVVFTGVGIIPALVAYVLLGIFLPETDEF